MNINRAKKVEIFLTEGTAQGLRYFDIKNRTCRMFVAPRASFKQAMDRPEVLKAGVYLLYSISEIDQDVPDEYLKPDSDLPQVYIGETDILLGRLTNHQREKDFWNELIFFVAQDEGLDKAKVRYLESKLIDRLTNDRLCRLENDTAPPAKILSESDAAVMDEFFDDILFLLSTAGYRLIFNKTESENAKGPALYITRDHLKAKGELTDEGFVVSKDSRARKRTAPSYGKSESKMRQALVNNGVLKEDGEVYVFMQDYPFNSPSLAAGVILGMNANGREHWKDAKGHTLKELQEQGLI